MACLVKKFLSFESAVAETMEPDQPPVADTLEQDGAILVLLHPNLRMDGERFLAFREEMKTKGEAEGTAHATYKCTNVQH